MRSLVALSLITALVACKANKPAAKDDKGSGSAVVATGSGSAGSAVEDKPGAPVPTANDVKMPATTGAPPKKTTVPLDQEAVDRLEKLEFPTFEKVGRSQGQTFEVRLLTPRPKLATTVTISKCFDCTPMDEAKWMEKKAALQNMLDESLRNHPDTKWELKKVEVNGVPMISVYQFGYTTGSDGQNQPTTAFANAYMLWYNDGVNQIRVVSEYKDDWVAKEDLAQIAPRADLEKLARTFMEVYTQAW